jgi:hypothetical protein
MTYRKKVDGGNGMPPTRRKEFRGQARLFLILFFLKSKIAAVKKASAYNSNNPTLNH